jgi:hypothetical protein
MTQLRADLLAGHAVAVAGPAGEALVAALRQLGARVEILDLGGQPEEENLGRWAREHGPLRAVLYDARPTFGAGGPDALTRSVHQSWLAVREVAVGALIEAAEPGKVILIAPVADAGAHASAAAAALESLVRTLSVEWARYGITSVLVAPAPHTDEGQLAELVCFVCSPGGQYLSGCRLEVGRRPG